MIDDGETDWKCIVINVDDILAPRLNDIDDVEAELPGFVSTLREWLRMYKTVDGKPVLAEGRVQRDRRAVQHAVAEWLLLAQAVDVLIRSGRSSFSAEAALMHNVRSIDIAQDGSVMKG